MTVSEFGQQFVGPRTSGKGVPLGLLAITQRPIGNRSLCAHDNVSTSGVSECTNNAPLGFKSALILAELKSGFLTWNPV